MRREFIYLSFLMILLASCVLGQQTGEEEPIITHTAPAIIETKIILTDTQVVEPFVLEIPTVAPPVIDGVLSPEEWDSALHTIMSDGSELYWIHADGFLYLGIQSSAIGAANLVILSEEQVWVLHSSAALGSAIYELQGDDWRLIQNFSWCCRSTINFEERDALFQTESWFASIGYLGEDGQVEYQVTAENNRIKLAVSYVFADGSVSYWPDSLNESSAQQLYGIRKDVESFSIEDWVTLVW
jgi:hypothetical protein